MSFTIGLCIFIIFLVVAHTVFKQCEQTYDVAKEKWDKEQADLAVKAKQAEAAKHLGNY